MHDLMVEALSERSPIGNEPESILLIAVIAQAGTERHTGYLGCGRKPKRVERAKAKAREWFSSQTFEGYCKLLGLDPDWVRWALFV